jgi:hypothetical protein
MSFCPFGHRTTVRQFDLERGPDLREDPAQIWTSSGMLILHHCTADTCFAGHKEPQLITSRSSEFGEACAPIWDQALLNSEVEQACLAGWWIEVLAGFESDQNHRE